MYQQHSGSPVPKLRHPPVTDDYPLLLITPHARFRINSHGHELGLKEDDRLQMHPQDARIRGIHEGEVVKVFNDIGWFSAEVHLNESIAPGVVSKLQGTWVELDGAKGSLGSGGSVNMVSPTEPTMPSNGSRTHTVGVQVVLP